MGFDSGMHSLGLTLQVFFIDLLLSGDNAIVIALACRRLPAQQMRQAILLGTGVAIALRILFTTIVTFLLAIPLLKLLGMVALITIAIKLLIDEDSDLDTTSAAGADAGTSAPVSLWATIGVIVVADVTMSLDNVVALAAISQNSVFFLVLGLALSIPLLMYGSLFVATLLKRYPILVPAGGALLGWIAGDIGMTDPLIADWVAAQLPGLTLAVPLACAVFVLVESKIIQQNLQRFPKSKLQPIPVTVDSGRANISTLPSIRTQALQAEVVANFAAAILPDQANITTSPEDQSMSRSDVDSGLKRSNPPLPGKPNSQLPPLFPKRKAFYFWVALLGLPVPVVIGSIIYKGVVNNGLMPPATQLIRYDCPGLQGSFSFYFRHGIETVKIQSSSGTLQGKSHNGKISWTNFSGDTSVLGFTPPQEITWDDAKSVRLNGGSFLQINCAKTTGNAPAQN